jgi:hypothetical protein
MKFKNDLPNVSGNFFFKFQKEVSRAIASQVNDLPGQSV